MSADEMGVVCSLVTLERGVSAGMGVGSGIARERDVCGNGVLARDSLGNGTSAGEVWRSVRFQDEYSHLKLMNGGSHIMQFDLLRHCERSDFFN